MAPRIQAWSHKTPGAAARTSVSPPPGPRNDGATTSLRAAGLFAGIGGFELGLSRAGHETSFLCEIEPGAMAVLAHHFPGIEVHPDVEELDNLPNDVTLLTVAFPCTDLSPAGDKEGGVDFAMRTSA